jgi:hypothetical protein
VLLSSGVAVWVEALITPEKPVCARVKDPGNKCTQSGHGCRGLIALHSGGGGGGRRGGGAVEW